MILFPTIRSPPLSPITTAGQAWQNSKEDNFQEISEIFLPSNLEL